MDDVLSAEVSGALAATSEGSEKNCKAMMCEDTFTPLSHTKGKEA